MSTPTPDPPPAAPLTAEEIAAIRDQWTDLDGDRATLCLSRAEWFGVWTTYDALRDRLARAEARCEALEYENSKQRDMLAEAILQLGGNLVVMPQVLMVRRDWIMTGPERRQPDGAYVWRVRRTIPTDGAARDGAR